MKEYFFTCLYCFEKISILIDTSLEFQDFIEDCEVCCNPMNIKVVVSEGKIEHFKVSKAY